MRVLLLPVLDTAALLLVVSGATKVLRGGAAREILHELRLPAAVAYPLGTLELSAGALALVAARPAVAACVAGLYATFACVVEGLRRRGGLASCGCLGAGSAPPSFVHTALDLAFAAGAAGAAACRTPSLSSSLAAHPFTGGVALLGITAATALAAAAIVYLPPLLTAYRREAP